MLSPYYLVRHQELTSRAPDIEGASLKVWTIKQDETIRVNLVEMSGELQLHSHPDAEHSLMLISGKVKVQAGEELLELSEGDFISIPAGVPHKYWSLTNASLLVSMDAPYYDPAKTIRHE